jgi:TonB family protein
MKVRGATFLLGPFAALLQGCATPQPQQPAPVNAAAASPRALPHAQIDMKRNWYPWQGLLQNLQGQTVVRFQIDRSGKATAIHVVASDSAPILQVTAVQLIQSARFDLKSVPFSPGDPNPFLVSIVFCIQRCPDLPAYPGTSDRIVITGPRP